MREQLSLALTLLKGQCQTGGDRKDLKGGNDSSATKKILAMT